VSLPVGHGHLPPERVVDRPATAASSTIVAPYLLEASQWIASGQGASNAALEVLDEVQVPASRKKTGSREGARVLVADDNNDMREYLVRLLSTRWQVDVAEDGQIALAKAMNEPPDLVLSDVMMPGLDGFALLRALRANPRMSHIPVVLVSARAGEEAVLEGLETGADDYLVKPFAARELIARVQTHLDLARLRREWAQELERANQELEAFSYSVAHDLRTPLRAIDGFSAALLNNYASTLDETGRHYLNRVRSGAQRMAQLIDDLLSLSRITRAPLNREDVDISSLSRRVLSDLRVRETERRVDSMVPDGLLTRADAKLVTVLLENLLGNAWKFTSKRPVANIEVGMQGRNGTTIFFVRDNGAGFNMEYAKKLFTPFQRLHTQAEFDGTGIGLATVQRIVTRHGGRIWAEASPDQGASFFFTLGDHT
jgi:signal transduction histidine kinase